MIAKTKAIVFALLFLLFGCHSKKLSTDNSRSTHASWVECRSDLKGLTLSAIEKALNARVPIKDDWGWVTGRVLRAHHDPAFPDEHFIRLTTTNEKTQYRVFFRKSDGWTNAARVHVMRSEANKELKATR